MDEAAKKQAKAKEELYWYVNAFRNSNIEQNVMRRIDGLRMLDAEGAKLVKAYVDAHDAAKLHFAWRTDPKK